MPNWKKVIVSGSNVSQLNNDGVYLRTTGDGVISSSAQLTGTFDTRYLNTTGDGVISSSAQIKTQISGAFTAPSGGFSTRITSLETAGGTTFSSSIASRVTTVETDLNTLESKTLVSSSAQLTPTFDTRYLNTTGDGVISSSAQLTSTFDTRYLNTTGDGVISSSAQVNHDATTNFVANEHIDHTTVSITAGNGLSGGGTIAATRTLTLNTSSAHFTDGVKKKLNTEGVISSSAQLTGTFDTRYLNTTGDGVISSSAQIKTQISGAFTAPSGGFSTRLTTLEGAGGTTFSSSVSTRLTSVEGYTLDNVTDNGSSTTNGITVGGLTVNGNATITGTLTAQQFNTEFVSSSIIFESGSTKFGDSIDDIHSFTGSVKLNTQTAATTDTDKFLVFDTGGEIKYRTGAEVLSDINPGGLVSSSAQLTTEFDTRYLNTTGDGVISSSAQVTISSTTGYTTFSSSIASDIAGLQGAGYIDGTGGNEFFARFTDSNTLTGSNHLQRDIHGNISINSRTGAWNLGSFAPLAPLTVKRGTDQGAVTHDLAYLQVPNGRASSLQFANGQHSTFIGQETDGDFYIGFGNNADRTFVFQNNGANGVPTLTLGTLTISGSGTLINIGPAQFSGSVSITTADQVAASVDTDKFLVLDGQQIKYRTGAQVLSDIGAAASSVKNYIDFNNVVDFKTIADGYAPMCGITDIQTSVNSPFAHWIAPSDGYIERIEVMVGETNTVTDTFSIQPYKNGSTLGSVVNNTQGVVRTVTEYAFGATYSFSKRDKIQFYMSKASNTSDLYTFNVYFFATT